MWIADQNPKFGEKRLMVIGSEHKERRNFMKKKRISAIFVTAVLILGLCSACGSQGTESSNDTSNEDENKPDKLVILMSSEGTGPMENAVKIFEEETGIKIELLSEAYDNMHNKIMTMVAGGSQLDIVSLDTVWPAEFADSELIVPLDDYVDDEFGAQFVDIAWEQLRYDGHQYGIPTGNDAKWLFYNKEILEKAGYTEPPKTWEEISEMSLKMKEEGLVKYGMALGASQSEGLTCDFTSFLYGFGGQYRENDAEASGEWMLNSKQSVEALTWLKDSMENGVIDPASTTYTDRNVMNTFMAGDVAFTTGWSSYWATTNSEEESAVAGKVGMTMLPGSKEAVSGSVAGGGGFAVVSTTASEKWSVEFLKLLCRTDVQKDFLSGVSQMPTLKELYNDEALTEEFPILDMAYPQYEYAHFRPILVQYQEWSKMVQEAIHKVIANNEDPKTVLNDLQNQTTEIIKR